MRGVQATRKMFFLVIFISVFMMFAFHAIFSSLSNFSDSQSYSRACAANTAPSRTPFPQNATQSFERFPRKIWIYWKQGGEIEKMKHEEISRCMLSWKTRNPGWEVILVSDETLTDYIDVDQANFAKAIKRKNWASDFARVALLERYGGVYADADLYSVLPLDVWLPAYVEPTGTWYPSLEGRTVTGTDAKRYSATWFMASFPQAELLSKWKRAMYQEWCTYGTFRHYHQMHYTFAMLMERDESFRRKWEETPHIKATLSKQEKCCIVALPHPTPFPRVSIRHNGGYLVELDNETKEMIDSGAIPMIKGCFRCTKNFPRARPNHSVIDYLDSLPVAFSNFSNSPSYRRACAANTAPSRTPFPQNATQSFERFPRKIWIYWKQGGEIEKMKHEEISRCMLSWKTRNPGWEVILVSDETLTDYIDVDQANFAKAIKRKNWASDFARVALLERYGGVYADADLYSVLPLDVWLPAYVEPTGTWYPSLEGRTVTGTDAKRYSATWFMASFPQAELLSKWKRAMYQEWCTYGTFRHYHQMHYTFAMLMERDESFRRKWEETPHIKATLSKQEKCCIVALPHPTPFPRVSIRHNGGYLVELDNETKEMIDSGAIPMIKGCFRCTKNFPRARPNHSVIDYLDSLPVAP